MESVVSSPSRIRLYPSIFAGGGQIWAGFLVGQGIADEALPFGEAVVRLTMKQDFLLRE
jgi:hypothetical protein